MMHSRWAEKITNINVISERLLAGKVSVWQRRLRVIVAYMPYAGCSDDEVASMYDVIEKLHEDAPHKHYITTIGGDRNAVVGKRLEEESQLQFFDRNSLQK